MQTYTPSQLYNAWHTLEKSLKIKRKRNEEIDLLELDYFKSLKGQGKIPKDIDFLLASKTAFSIYLTLPGPVDSYQSQLQKLCRDNSLSLHFEDEAEHKEWLIEDVVEGATVSVRQYKSEPNKAIVGFDFEGGAYVIHPFSTFGKIKIPFRYQKANLRILDMLVREVFEVK
jgi:hypothetical protein